MSAKKTIKVSTATAFPFMSILTLIFVCAKLFHLIEWSWWLVFLPMWGPIALFLAGLLIFLLIILVAAVLS